tara:strand:- start:115 stop:435 length:321 start_codon:yes stop_codon:yes gene_type:complete
MDLILSKNFLYTRKCVKYKNFNIKMNKSSITGFLSNGKYCIFRFDLIGKDLLVFLRKFERSLLANSLDPNSIIDCKVMLTACEDLEDLIRAIKYANPSLKNIDEYI